MAADMFLKLDGIKGESKDAKHAGEIHIDTFSWGMTQAGSFGQGGGGGAGKVNVHDISITKVVDASSPTLMINCASGKHIKDGVLTVRKAGEHPLEYLKIKLTDILISSIQTAGHGGDVLSESISLNFSKFKVEYYPQKQDGSADKVQEMGWDIKANTKA